MYRRERSNRAYALVRRCSERPAHVPGRDSSAREAEVEARQLLFVRPPPRERHDPKTAHRRWVDHPPERCARREVVLDRGFRLRTERAEEVARSEAREK